MEKIIKITAERGAHRHRSSGAREPRRVVDGGGGEMKITEWRVEISPCYNSRGNTGVDKRVFLSDQYATVRCANGPSGQLLITHSTARPARIDGARTARKKKIGSTEDPFWPRKNPESTDEVLVFEVWITCVWEWWIKMYHYSPSFNSFSSAEG